MPCAPGESDVRWPLMWMTFSLELNASSPSVAPDAARMVACPTAPFPTPPDILEWHATSAAARPAMTAIPAFTMVCLCDCQAKHKPDAAIVAEPSIRPICCYRCYRFFLEGNVPMLFRPVLVPFRLEGLERVAEPSARVAWIDDVVELAPAGRYI